MKFCKDCKYFEYVTNSTSDGRRYTHINEPTCNRDELACPVLAVKSNPKVNRHDENLCGLSARYWEAK